MLANSTVQSLTSSNGSGPVLDFDDDGFEDSDGDL